MEELAVSLANEIVEKILCIEIFLDDAFFVERAENKPLVEILQREIKSAKEFIRDPLLLLSEDGRTSDIALRRICRRFIGASGLIDAILLSYRYGYPEIMFIRGKETSPDLDIFIENMLPSQFKKREKTDIYLALQDEYNFGETISITRLSNLLWDYRVIDEEPGPSPILSLPKIFNQVPLMWTSLMHELGHFFSGLWKIVDKILEGPSYRGHDSDKFDLTKHWMEEIFADLFAIRTIGPAYFAAWVTFFLMDDDPFRVSETHPPPNIRFEIQKNELKKRRIKSPVIDFYAELWEKRCNEFPCVDAVEIDSETISYGNFNSPTLPEPIIEPNDMASLLRTPVNKIKIPIYSKNNIEFKKIQQLSNDLKNKIPICSYNPTDIQILRKLKEIKNRDDMEKILTNFIDAPVNMIEIMNAGWLYLANNKQTIFKSNFLDKMNDNYLKAYEKYKKKVIYTNSSIIQSIEVASIHNKFYRMNQQDVSK